MSNTTTGIPTHYHSTDAWAMPCYLPEGHDGTTYTVTVACQLIPMSQFSASIWKHETYQITEESSWIGFGRASMSAMAQAEGKYGERMMIDTSYVMEISPSPA